MVWVNWPKWKNWLKEQNPFGSKAICPQLVKSGCDMYGTLYDVPLDCLPEFLKGLQQTSPFPDEDFCSDIPKSDEHGAETLLNNENNTEQGNQDNDQTLLNSENNTEQEDQENDQTDCPTNILTRRFENKSEDSIAVGILVIRYSDNTDSVDILYHFVSKKDHTRKEIREMFRSAMNSF